MRIIGGGSGLRLVALALVLALGACGGGKIEVTRLAELPGDAPAAPNFVVVRAKTQDRAPDFAEFADRIAKALTAKGLARVDAPAQARYALMFSYDGDGSKSEADVWKRNNKSKNSEGKQERTVAVALFDLTRPNQTNEKVWGGQARCSVETSNRKAVVEALIDAVMKDYPGKGRETYSVSLPDID